MEDKLINLGTNRFTFRPQLGVVHNRGKLSMELTDAVWLYTDNDDFFNGNKLEQDPYYTIQAHLIYTFRPGLWTAASAGYGYGGESTVSGVKKNDRRENLAWALSFAVRSLGSWVSKSFIWQPVPKNQLVRILTVSGWASPSFGDTVEITWERKIQQ
jgi:Putative MetA-pathway of phenol degradation